MVRKFSDEIMRVSFKPLAMGASGRLRKTCGLGVYCVRHAVQDGQIRI